MRLRGRAGPARVVLVEVPVSGHCDARFRAVREEFARNFAERGEVGAAVCIVVDGVTVVDLAGGWADGEAGRAWRQDTLVDFYSVGKAFVALLALQLVDAGRVALDDPIAGVWPEFAAAGKEGATLRQALCHRAGVPAIRRALVQRRPLGLGPDGRSAGRHARPGGSPGRATPTTPTPTGT